MNWGAKGARVVRVEDTGGLTGDDLRSFFSTFGNVADIDMSDQPSAVVEFAAWSSPEAAPVEELLLEAALGYHYIGDVEVSVSRGVQPKSDPPVVAVPKRQAAPPPRPEGAQTTRTVEDEFDELRR